MITLKIQNLDDVTGALESQPELVMTALRQGMMSAMLKLARYIAEQKLSGQVLNVRTGTLRRAILGSPQADRAGDVVSGSVSTDPASWYGRVQEYGAHIPEVSGKLMVFPMPGVPAKTMAGVIFTRHHRAFDLPARPFMSTSLEEQQDMILAELSQAVATAVAGGAQ